MTTDTAVETRFCTSCQAVRSTEGGVVKPTRGVPRWVCKPCLERKTVSQYMSAKRDVKFSPRGYYD